MTAVEQSPLSFQDIWRMFQETDLRYKENAQSFKETERLMKERDAEIALRFKETDRIVKNLSKNIGDLGNRLGEFVEHMVAPAVVRLFQSESRLAHDLAVLTLWE